MTETMTTMKIESPRFGSLMIEPSRVLELPQGLAGFEGCTRFALFHRDGGEPGFFILQSIDDPDIAFLVTDPARFGFDYEIALSDEEVTLLQLASADEATVVVMLLRELAADGSEGPVQANLKAPLIFNCNARRGLQHVFARLDYKVTLSSGSGLGSGT
jgi:flagellar assembly factor FliW